MDLFMDGLLVDRRLPAPVPDLFDESTEVRVVEESRAHQFVKLPVDNNTKLRSCNLLATDQKTSSFIVIITRLNDSGQSWWFKGLLQGYCRTRGRVVVACHPIFFVVSAGGKNREPIVMFPGAKQQLPVG